MDWVGLEDEIVAWIMFFTGALLTCIYPVKFLHFTPSGLTIVVDTVIVFLSLTLMFIGVEGIFDTGITLRI